MNFLEIYNQFEKSTVENFPVKCCNKKNEREPDVYDSDTPFMCLVIDERFDDYWTLAIMHPYIYKEPGSETTFGWVDVGGNVFGNIENSTNCYMHEYVVGFKEYDDNHYKELRDEFIEKIKLQFDD